MSDFLQMAGGSGYGVFPANVDVTVTNRTAASLDLLKGDAVVFQILNRASISANSGPSVTMDPGGIGSVFANVARAGTATTTLSYDRDFGVVGVMLENVGYQKSGKCRIRGVANTRVCNTLSTVVSVGVPITLPLSVTTTSYGGCFEAGNTSASIASNGMIWKVFGFTTTSATAADASVPTVSSGTGWTTQGGAPVSVVFDGINGMGSLNASLV